MRTRLTRKNANLRLTAALDVLFPAAVRKTLLQEQLYGGRVHVSSQLQVTVRLAGEVEAAGVRGSWWQMSAVR